MATTKIRGNTQIISGTITDTEISSSAAISTSKLADGSEFVKRNGSVALTGNLDANSNKVINLATPTSANDAASKSYVDAVANGIQWKQSVRVATTMAATLATDFQNGNSKDGVILVTGDRILIKNQATGSENGIYTVNASGAPTRATDADTSAEVVAGIAVFVQEGIVNGDTGWVLTTNNPITLDTTSLTFTQFSSLGSVVGGLDVKNSVRVATTGAGTLATDFQNGNSKDGVILVTDDRILVKNQATASENGIYIVQASGAPVRAPDADTSEKVSAGLFVFVEEGTVNADTAWVLTTNNPITLGTTSLTFSQFSSTGDITAGNGLTRTGNTIDVVSGNGGIVANANDITLTVANASLTIVSGGIKIPDATAGQVVVADGSGIPVSQTLSGDVSSVSGTGVVTLNASTIVKVVNVVTREVPSGSINGSNVTFTLANTPVSGTEMIFLNGLLQDVGGANDYTISGATITFNTAPSSGSKLVVSYLK